MNACGGSTDATCAELVSKLGSGLAEVRDRALRAIGSKVEGGLVPIGAIASIPGLAQRLLHWINDRQTEASPALVRLCLRLITALAQAPCAAPSLHQAGCVRFLEEFRQMAGTFSDEIDVAQAALLAHSTSAKYEDHRAHLPTPPSTGRASIQAQTQTSLLPGLPVPVPGLAALSQPQGLATPQQEQLNVAAGSSTGSRSLPAAGAQSTAHTLPTAVPQLDPQRARTSARADAERVRQPPVTLGEVDAQLLMDVSVRLRYGDPPTLQACCCDLRDVVCNFPAHVVILHGPLIDGLCHAMRVCTSGAPISCACDVLDAVDALVTRLHMQCSSQSKHCLVDTSILPAAPLFSLLVEVLRHGLHVPVLVAITYRVFNELVLLCTPTFDSRPFAVFCQRDVALCVQLAGRSLQEHLERSRCEVWCVHDALGWFDCLVSCPVLPGGSKWPKPLVTHAWTSHGLAIYDIFFRLLCAFTPVSLADLATEFPPVVALLSNLLFDHRLLFERPSCIALLQYLAILSVGDAQDFEAFRDLCDAACNTPQQPHGETSNKSIDFMLRRLPELQGQLRLVTLGDDMLAPRNLAASVVSLVVDVARQQGEHPGAASLQHLEDGCAALSARMAVCPHAETQDAFFGMLEEESEAEWLFRRTDFVLDCICAGGERAAKCVVRWRQGDCKAGGRHTPPAAELLELVEAACLEVTPSTVASTLRRLFAADRETREAAALLLWRGEAAAGRLASMSSLKFVTDPVGDVLEESRCALQAYVVHGLQSAPQDVAHLHDIVANARLGWEVRTTGLVQLTTFVASDRSGRLSAGKDTEGTLARTVVDLVQCVSARAIKSAQDEGWGGAVEFATRLCHAGAVLLLVDSEGTAAAQHLHNRKQDVLDRLVTLVFHTFVKLRAASLQFIAALLFNPEALRFSCTRTVEPQHMPKDDDDTLAFRVPPWLHRGYILPLSTTTGGMHTSPAVEFWRVVPRWRALALCQVFHRLHTALGAAFHTFPSFSHLPTTLDGSARGGRSVVQKHTEDVLSSASSTEELLEAARSYVLISPVGLWLLQHRKYLARLLSGISRPLHLEHAHSTNYELSVRERSAVVDLHISLLEHILTVLRALPSQSSCERRPLEQLAEAMHADVLPVTMHLVAGEATSLDLPEGVLRRARGLLSAEARTRCMLELLLQVGVALAHRKEVSIHWLAPRRWLPLLSIVVACTHSAVRRLAFAFAFFIAPASVHSTVPIDPTHLGGGDYPGTGDSNGMFAIDAFASAVLQCLSAPATSAVSFQHCFELKTSLWLVGKFAGSGICGAWTKAGSGDILACVTSWLAHVDVGVTALAWRTLRRLLQMCYEHPGGTSESFCTDHAGVVTRALRALRKDGQVSQVLDASAHAEAFEILRMCLDAASAEAGHLEAYVKQILEAGILTANGLRSTLMASHSRGLQRSAVRFLHALLTADYPRVNGILVHAGVWPHLVAAVSAGSTDKGEGDGSEQADDQSAPHGPNSQGGALEIAALMGDVAAIVGTVAIRDPQMLLWLSTATEFLRSWHSVIVDLGVEIQRAPPTSVRVSRALTMHLSSLFAVTASLKCQMCQLYDDASSHLEHWVDVIAFVRSPAILTLLAEGMHEKMPIRTRQMATATAATFYGLVLVGAAATPCEDNAFIDELLVRRACTLFQWSSAQPAAPAFAAAPPAARQADAAEVCQSYPMSCPMVAHCCLLNMFSASPPAAEAAWQFGFLRTLVAHIEALHIARTGEQQPQVACLLWALRVLSALLASSSKAMEEVMSPRAVDASVRGSSSILASMITYLRPSCEKDDAVCLEVLDVLLQCLRAEQDPGKDDREGQSLPAFLLRLDFVPWLMRMSQRKQLATAVYCKVLAVLSRCAPVLTGKPITLRFLIQIVEHLRTTFKSLQFNDDWRCRRLVATFHFLACLRLCPRGVALVAGAEPCVHAPAVVVTGMEQAGGLGLDAWLDLIDVEARTLRTSRGAHDLRVAGLRVLLAVAISKSPHAKAYFLASSRAIPLFLRILQKGRLPMPSVALSILWVLAHNNQRLLPLLRRLGASEIIQAAAAKGVAEDLMAEQLCAILG